MLAGLIGLCATVVTGVLSLTGAAGVAVPGLGADLASDPLAIVDTIVDSPVAGAEVFAAGGLPGIATSAGVVAGDYENPAFVGADAYIPVGDALPALPVVGPASQAPMALAASTINGLGYSLGTLLLGLPINLLGAVPIL